MSRRLRIFLFIWSQIGWFGCVYFARQGGEVLALIFPFVAWLILFLSKTNSWQSMRFLFFLALVGTLFDSLLSQQGFISFHSGWGGQNLLPLPLWLVSIWLLFVTSIPSLSAAFAKRVKLASVVGMIAGPISYASGERLEVLVLKGYETLFIYSLFWAVFFGGSVFWYNRKFEGNIGV